MNLPDASLVLYWSLNFLMIFILAVMMAVWIVAIWRIVTKTPLVVLPSFGARRPAPWKVGTLATVLFLYVFVDLSIFGLYANITGRVPETSTVTVASGRSGVDTYGRVPEGEGGVSSPDQQQIAHPLSQALENTAKLQSKTERLLQYALAKVLMVVLVIVFLRRKEQAGWDDLGLTSTRIADQIATGVRSALLMIPVVYLVQLVATRIWTPRNHPLEELIRGEGSSPVSYFLVVVTAVLIAPTIEELLFRVILQGWLTKILGTIDHLTTTNSCGDAQGPCADRPESEGATIRASGAEPERSVQTLPKADGLKASVGAPASLAILLSCLVFALLHYEQWPAPLALFTLSLAIGWIYRQTGSLCTIIAMHATFNGFSTLMLFIEVMRRGNGAPNLH